MKFASFSFVGRRSVTVFGLLVACAVLKADVRLAPPFADGAVLQRDRPLPVWGWAAAGEKVTVDFQGQRQSTTASDEGRWKVVLTAVAASARPSVLVVTGNNRLQVNNVLVGDVWLCSGQSNMEWSVATALNPQEEAALAVYPAIRHAKIPRTVADSPADEVKLAWVECSPATVLRFSAVAYFFARDQHDYLKGVPIGLVTSAWGGTEIESWIGGDVLRSDRDFEVVYRRWQQRLDDYPAAVAAQQLAVAEWEQAAAAAKARGQKFTRRKPAEAEGAGSRWLPSGLYNAMIHPLREFPFKGVLWYQGEANEFRASEYAKLMRTLIQQWRRDFGQPELPFYFVQLANFATSNDSTGTAWAFLREAQTETLSLPHTGMVVTVDIGEDRDIHFKNKQETGRRLSLLARAQLHGESIEYSGPRFANVRSEGNTLRLSFTHANGLRSKRESLGGFIVAGEDMKFHPAQARIDGETVVVFAPEVAMPVAVRYAWSNTPQVDLFNAAGLPASPFRSDNWSEK